MTSDKAGIALLADIFTARGLKHIVVSPGSRNAPVILSFATNPKIKAINIVDERSAAFFALGIAQQTRHTVAITCTSGSAALNYAPAIAEAYYQKIPLLILTADRPEELVDVGDGQTIRQKNLYANYIKKSFELPEKIVSEKEYQNAVQMINEALNLTLYPDCGPVHINLPFTEPIYNQVENSAFKPKLIEPDKTFFNLNQAKIRALSKIWNASSKKLLIAGQMDPNPELQKLLVEITKDKSVVMLSETTSNINGGCSCNCIDKAVATIKMDEAKKFQPDLLVTFGGQVVSKMVKAFLRNHKPINHWHIHPEDFQMDTYHCLTEGIQSSADGFFESLNPYIKKGSNHFKETWKSRVDRSESRHKDFLSACDYSDLKVFETLLSSIPQKTDLHLGNSTPVRYAQLFQPKQKLNYYSNRGTSGIDGSVSTAAGASYVNEKLTTLITGDLSFLYDSNALMNHHLNGKLRIIIINNSGGGIFRIIQGPDKTNKLEEFFEARHNWNAKYIAKNFDVPYYSSSSLNELKTILPDFFGGLHNNRPTILEIFTPNEKNGKILKSYFNYLKD